MTMLDENGITPISIRCFEQIQTLVKRIKIADKTLPSPLTQSQIHQIQTDIETIYRINMEKSYVFFSKHILSTTYPPIPIDKEFSFTLSPSNAISVFGKKSALDRIKSVVKSTIKPT